jgi:uncharacterized protein
MMRTHHLFIAALSGRALAQAAQEASIACTVADCFGDADTIAFAEHWNDVCAVDSLDINAQAVCAALRACARAHADEQLIVITGSGFEANLTALKALENTAHEVGAVCAFNSSEVMQNLLDPLRFFAAVRASGALHPRTQIEPPEDAQGWLIKQVGGQGATHVRPANQAKFSSANSLVKPIYCQEEHSGCERSICFIAKYSGVVSLGFNLQLVDRTNDQGFCYRGALGGDALASALPESLRTSLLESLAQLCKHFNLRGLGSLDFIEHEGRAYVLEINARPTASFELYAAKLALIEHLAAFGVHVLCDTKKTNELVQCRGHRYVFAQRSVAWTELHDKAIASIAAQITDRPRADSAIPEGAPLCNLHASGASIVAVHSELLALEHKLLALIASAEWKEAA